jgi:glycosyltransferase involved in cell wall biosynthesis
MNVCLIHQRLNHKGGLERRLYNYMQYFLDRGDGITIVAAKISSEVVLPESVKLVHLDISRTIKFYRPVVFNKRVHRFLKDNQFDFVLSLERTSNYGNLIGPNTHKGYMRAHNAWLPDPSDLVQLYMDRISFTNARRVYACSNMIRNEIISDYKVPADRVQVLPPPLNTKVFYKNTIASKSELKLITGFDASKKQILFVSNNHRLKGLQLALNTLKQLNQPDVELVVIGKTGPEQEGARYLGVQNNPADFYRAADLTIHPAIYEPFGQVIAESISCGTPVLISKRTGSKDIVTDQCGAVMDNYDPKAWAEQVRRMLNRTYDIPADFAVRNGLDLNSHMSKMLSGAGY